ncbi:protein SRG1-like isoform X2 [Amaranthus tricolor]|uniref:protein SRG1-like isoform X2 n=1 Tax=Amaranthus tricolor TaxID=29722 RepID=UPI00258F39D1|nr:protein SRG1-like isoform X2 [Amaranthus tricolor]
MSVSSAPLMNLELPSKPVQELIRTTAKQVPQKYIYQSKSTDFSDIQYMETSTIDFNLLSSSSSNEQQQELQKLQSVLTSWGCFQVKNHGLSTSLIDGIREVGKEFFALPLEVKERHKRTIDSFQGYGGDTVSDGQNYNWNDRLHLKVHPLQHRNFEFWPDYLPNFRETVEEYIMEVKKVVEMILKSIAKLLNLEENMIFNICGGNEGINMYTRFNYYPPCSSADQVLGLKPHSDGTVLTVLLQDKQVEGLQVLKDNKWFKVPIVPDALFINLGDQLENEYNVDDKQWNIEECSS